MQADSEELPVPREATAELRELYSPELAPDALTVRHPLGVDSRAPETRFLSGSTARAETHAADKRHTTAVAE